MIDKNKLKGHMQIVGLTTVELSELLGMNVDTLRRKIRGDGDFSVTEILKIAKLLELESIEEIFFPEFYSCI